MSSTSIPIDELIEARWVIPIEPYGAVLDHHAIALHNGRIVDLLPIADARERYVPEQTTALPQHAVTPGLINLHTHAAMTLMRGVGDDLPLMQWLQDRVWPIEKALLSHAFVLDGTRLACLEMLRGGTTCFADMYFFLDAAAQAATEIGMRANLGIIVIDFPTAWASDVEGYLQQGLALRDQMKEHELLSFCFAPHSPFTIRDSSFERIAILADQIGLPIQIHLHETQDEIRQSLQQYGCRPIERLRQLGLVGPQLTAIHAVHLNTQEISLFKQNAVNIAHCPTSNLKLASGIAPTAAYLDAGINLGIGTDGAASNNRLDMMAEMRLAALLGKGASGCADIFQAHDALRAATLNGAKALGLEQRIGSITVGKEADLVAFDFSGHNSQPCFDPASHLVFVLDREQVSDVWVRGEAVVRMQQFTRPAANEALRNCASTTSLWQNLAQK